MSKSLQKESLFTWLTRTNIANSRGQRLIHRKLIGACNPEKDGTEPMEILCGSSQGLANMAFTYKFSHCHAVLLFFFFRFSPGSPISSQHKNASELHIAMREKYFPDRLASEYFALVVMVSDEFFELKEKTPLSPEERFIEIASRLPMELQMVGGFLIFICWRLSHFLFFRCSATG